MTCTQPRILLLEPDKVLANTYTQALQVRGFLVDHAASAQAAISYADKRQPDVVLMELQLAGHSGVAFLYEFRSYADWRCIPVVVHTMLPLRVLEDVQSGLQELGVQICLYKPQTSLRELVSTAQRQLVTQQYVS